MNKHKAERSTVLYEAANVARNNLTCVSKSSMALYNKELAFLDSGRYHISVKNCLKAKWSLVSSSLIHYMFWLCHVTFPVWYYCKSLRVVSSVSIYEFHSSPNKLSVGSKCLSVSQLSLSTYQVHISNCHELPTRLIKHFNLP